MELILQLLFWNAFLCFRVAKITVLDGAICIKNVFLSYRHLSWLVL